MPAFSSQLSPMVHRDKKIKMHKEPGNPIETRTYYGLTEWYNGDKLKPDYLNKIIKQWQKNPSVVAEGNSFSKGTDEEGGRD